MVSIPIISSLRTLKVSCWTLAWRQGRLASKSHIFGGQCPPYNCLMVSVPIISERLGSLHPLLTC